VTPRERFLACLAAALTDRGCTRHRLHTHPRRNRLHPQRRRRSAPMPPAVHGTSAGTPRTSRPRFSGPQPVGIVSRVDEQPGRAGRRPCLPRPLPSPPWS
jgi:hypothetical protein